MRAYLGAIEAEERRQQRDLLILLRAAQAETEGFEKVLGALGPLGPD